MSVRALALRAAATAQLGASTTQSTASAGSGAATAGESDARCVRHHGVPSFPDPGSDGRIPDPATAGIDQGSPKFEAANQACGRYRPRYMPSNAAHNAWAGRHG